MTDHILIFSFTSILVSNILFFYYVSNFEEFLIYYLLFQREIIFLVGYYDLQCQMLLLGQEKHLKHSRYCQKILKLTSHDILHYFQSADLEESFSQLIVL